MNILTEIELYDLNRGEVDDLFSRIDAVTLERANEVIKKYYAFRQSDISAARKCGEVQRRSEEVRRRCRHSADQPARVARRALTALTRCLCHPRAEPKRK